MRATTIGLVCGSALWWTLPARAQSEQAEVLGKLANDIAVLTVNTPIWLASHIPSMIQQTGTGAGIDLSTDAPGFAIGVFPLRIGIMNQFNQVGYGTQVLKLDQKLPSNVPWLQFGATAAVGLSHGIELNADFQFIPDMDLNIAEDLSLRVAVVSVAGALRWRINESKWGIPAFTIGFGAGYYHGLMELGAGFSSPYTVPTSYGDIEGTYKFQGGPKMTWDLWQLTPELRIGWKAGPVRPYLGFSYSYTGGVVTGKSSLKAEATVERVAGNPVAEEPTIYTDTGLEFDAPAAKHTLRPHVGLDIVIAMVAITLQVDFAIMANDKIDEDSIGNAAGSFDPGDDNFLYSEASAKATTSAAIVSTLALRLQF
jgi:hypothetical protein